MTVFPDLVDSLPKKVDLVRNQLWLRLKSDILVLAMEDRVLQKSCNINAIKRFVSICYCIDTWFTINFLRLFFEDSRKSSNFAAQFWNVRLFSQFLPHVYAYVGYMLTICWGYVKHIFLRKILWVTYDLHIRQENFVEVHEDERENRQFN